MPRLGTKRQSRRVDLLGFTHYWRRSRQGDWVVYRKTAGYRHEPIEEQHRMLTLKLRGHYTNYSYYGISGNFVALDLFRSCARELWCKWLSRRPRASAGPTAMGVALDAHALPRPRSAQRHRVHRYDDSHRCPAPLPPLRIGALRFDVPQIQVFPLPWAQ
jgi:hypothetical protein